MKETIQHEKYGEIVYDENFWTGRKSLSMGGVPLTKISKKDFQTESGSIGTVKGSFLFGASLYIEGETIRLTPTVQWYEIVLAILPFILIMVWGNTVALCKIVPVVGGALGGGLSGLFSILSLFTMRSVKPIWAKILIGIAFIGGAFGICCGIGYAIIS